MPLARADVRGVCFAHWPVDPRDLSDRLPPALAAATRDGSAWVSVLAQRTNAGVGGVPGRYGFSQVAVRTYVVPADADQSDDAGGGDRTGTVADADRSDDAATDAGSATESAVGVYFLAIAADTPVARLARRVFGVPFHRASVRIEYGEDAVTVRAERPAEGVLYDANVEPTGDPATTDRGSLVDWLTERYRYYLPDGRTGTVAHAPWAVAPAEGVVRTRTLFEWADVPVPVTDPRLYYSPGIDIWLTARP